MFQAVFAFGIVVATVLYALLSMVRFLLPSKNRNRNETGCAEGNCNCSSSGHPKTPAHIRESRYKVVKLN